MLQDSKIFQQNTQGISSKSNINNPSLGNTSLVSKDFEHINQEFYFAALEKKLFEKSHKENSSPNLEHDPTTVGLGIVLDNLQEERILKAASDLTSKSRRPNSNANYESSYKKWASWCFRMGTD